MLRTKVERPGKWTAIPLGIRIACSRNICQICALEYGRIHASGTEFTIPIQHLDHLIPRRWLTERGIDPHQPENILSVCQFDHGKKKIHEDSLFRGDVLGYFIGLRTAGYPLGKISIFAKMNGLDVLAKGLADLRGNE